MTLTKDEQYYFEDEDGTCTFQVDDHLFKIHQYLLTRESPFFVKLFELPRKSMTGEDRTEVYEKGSSDDNPFICHDSVASFRTLCWGLYLRPLEVRKQEDPAHVDLNQLISLASIAHKYKFELLEQWAVATLREHCMNTLNPSEEETKLSWPLDTMIQLLALSLKTNAIDQKFKATIESQWLSSSIDNIEDPADIQRVLDFVDGFSSQRVYGLTYYRVLRGFKVFPVLRTSTAQNSPGNPFPKLTPDAFLCPHKTTGMLAGVSPEQRLKLMHGFLRLVSIHRTNSLDQVQFGCTCKVLPEVAPPLPSVKVKPGAKASVPQINCRLAWTRICTITQRSNTLDFGAMLEEALRRVKKGEIGVVFTDGCQKQLRAELRSLLASFEANLVDYFTLLS